MVDGGLRGPGDALQRCPLGTIGGPPPTPRRPVNEPTHGGSDVVNDPKHGVGVATPLACISRSASRRAQMGQVDK
eukprot:7986930-Alexandrium_andersonii.AAC.1